MNNVFKMLLLGTLLAGSAGAIAAPIDYVDLRVDGIFVNDGQITVKSANDQYAGTEKNTIQFHTEIKAGCNGLNNLKEMSVYGGNVNYQGGGVQEANPDVYSKSVAHGNQKSIGYTEVVLDIPLNKLDFNPVQVCNDMLQTKMNQGKSKNDIMGEDQVVTRQLTLSGVAACGNNNYYDTDHLQKEISITCKSSAAPKPAIPLGNNGGIKANKPVVAVPMGGNEIANNLPYKLDKADFQGNIPDYNGKCVPDKNPTIRINFQASGSKHGVIDLRVAAVSNTYGAYGNYFETVGIVNDPEQNSHLDFLFPLKEMLSDDKYSYMTQANKTWSHNMRVEARYKNLQDGTWSTWENFDTAVFKHRCAPSVAVPMGQQGGIKFNNQQPDAPKGIQMKPQKPDSKPSMNIQAKPLPPSPPPKLTIKAAPAEPEQAPKRAQ